MSAADAAAELVVAGDAATPAGGVCSGTWAPTIWKTGALPSAPEQAPSSKVKLKAEKTSRRSFIVRR
jgi:hypothetical protein